MENQRKVGILVMVTSIFLAIGFFLLSSEACFTWQLDQSIPLGWFRYCLNFRFFSDDMNQYAINIPYKYLLLFCVFSFACGYLIKQNVIRIPSKLKS